MSGGGSFSISDANHGIARKTSRSFQTEKEKPAGFPKTINQSTNGKWDRQLSCSAQLLESKRNMVNFERAIMGASKHTTHYSVWIHMVFNRRSNERIFAVLLTV